MHSCFWTPNHIHMASWIWSETSSLPSLLGCLFLGFSVIVLGAEVLSEDSTGLGRRFGTLRKKLTQSLSTNRPRTSTLSREDEGRTTLVSSLAVSGVLLLMYLFSYWTRER